jgi:hypothetical protein
MHAPTGLGDKPRLRRGEHLDPKTEAESYLYLMKLKDALPYLAMPDHTPPDRDKPCQTAPSNTIIVKEGIKMIPCIPSTNIKACIREAGRNYRVSGRRTTFAAMIRAGLDVNPFPMVPLLHNGWEVDIRPVVVQRNRILRARPRFDEWILEFQIVNQDPTVIHKDTLKKILEDAGKYYGLGDFRPEFGLFEVEEFTGASSESSGTAQQL